MKALTAAGGGLARTAGRLWPTTGAGGAPGAASARSTTYWPVCGTLAVSAVPSGDRLASPSTVHALTVGSQRASVSVIPPPRSLGARSDTAAAVPKATPRGEMSSAATGDQPSGNRAANPCGLTAVSRSDRSDARAPAGTLRFTSPARLDAAPPVTDEIW